MKYFLLFVFSLFITNNWCFAQEVNQFDTIENKLAIIYKKINRFAEEKENIQNNNTFISLLDSVLRIPESFFYPFSDIECGNITSEDKKFRIITWNMIHTDGTYENFGFMQVYNKDSKKIKLYKFIDKSKTLKNQMQLVCSPKEWIGATYYMVCQKKYQGQVFYTLIGWNPNTIYTQKKIIETLKFDNSNEPVFGFPIVELKGKGYQRRIIFEYSSKNSMMLRYDSRKKMIVFDHLAPSDFRYTDIYEFYGPDFSIDGYKFTKGKWRYQSDIDVRNKRTKFSDYLPRWLVNMFRKKETEENGLGF